MSISDFVFPYGTLKADNRWVRLAELIPWDEVERKYSQGFANDGAPAHPARMALGSLIIKQVLKCSDEELCNQVAENAYLQYLVGMKEFTKECPFGASTLVAFRKRFSEEDIAWINELILKRNAGPGRHEKCNDDCDDDDTDDDTPGGAGEVTMALDATVAPSEITFPQDVKLLNTAREKLEGMVAWCCIQAGAKRPRMYSRKARIEFLDWSKSKKRTAKKTRRAIRQQLQYIRRDLGYLDSMILKYTLELPKDMACELITINMLYVQQLYMYEYKTHSVKDRIVSISQPWVRPIVRGKAKVNTEFGAKVHISTDNGGFARIERISFDAFNESEGLTDAVMRFFKRTGYFPERILADQIYRSRSNLAWCAKQGIRLSGPKLGRPPKDASATREQKATERKDAADRNIVEGVFGTTKRVYGLDPVAAKLEGTTRTVISLAILVFNLKKLLRASLSFFWAVLDWLGFSSNRAGFKVFSIGL